MHKGPEAKYLDYTAIYWGYTLAGRKVNICFFNFVKGQRHEI